VTLSKSSTTKEPIRWTGVLFAFAANLLLVTISDAIFARGGTTAVAVVIAPLIAGAVTAVYTRVRGAMTAFIGAIIALPVLAIAVFPAAWPLAVFATLFCVMGGALTELALRRPKF
jgi:hypothetical protein